MIERIDTICVTVSNVEQASQWYEDMLGFKVSFKGETYRILSIGNSEVPFTIEEGNTVSTNKRGAYPIFYTKNINETYHKLKGQGVNVGELQIDGANHFFDFYDLDNNRLQVCFWE
ncbi:VOC family protein [Fredinandcohnia humi]